MIKQVLFLIVFCFFISSLLVSCAEKVVWKHPQRDYRECLKENPDDPSKCESKRQAYEKEVEELRGKSTEEGGAGSIYEK
ncbi:MAG: hypothetical protein GTO02_21280 [Candidatus Dadabacteria bacterium]|nr:hypothetical protein [Candidatus Dadabacteria bacterium]NIQ16818.1 hypothetical protein [Candidatus Dadabacteria bacterium]